MPRQAVSSSNLASVGYDSESQILEVEFRSGRIYEYFDVPQKVYAALLKAASLGSYFNAKIKDKYRYRRIR